MSYSIWIAPSSGGKFANQLGLISDVCEILDKPNICLCTSGGNLATFITLASDFSPNGILRVCSYIRSELFSHNWWPDFLNFLPSWIIGTFKGSIYKAGSGGEKVMKHIFTPHNVTQLEIWTGTMESQTGKAQLFCNKDQKESILGDIEFDFKLKNCKPHKFLDGDIIKIAKACNASASIPVYVPNQIIDDVQYADGGTVYWSPLTPMADSLNILAKDKPLHITYFNGSDLESECDVKSSANIVQNTDTTLDRILKTLAISDRLHGIDLVRKYKKYQKLYFHGKCNSNLIKKIKANLKHMQRSFLELYRKDKMELDITNFEPKDIQKIINETRKCYYFRLWIAGSLENCEHLKNTFSEYE